MLVSPRSPVLQTLNPVATRVWELADGRPLGEIVEVIVNEFDVSSTEARGDVEEFVRELEAKGMILLGKSEPK